MAVEVNETEKQEVRGRNIDWQEDRGQVDRELLVYKPWK
jgi:hypothetical protein